MKNGGVPGKTGRICPPPPLGRPSVVARPAALRPRARPSPEIDVRSRGWPRGDAEGPAVGVNRRAFVGRFSSKTERGGLKTPLFDPFWTPYRSPVLGRGKVNQLCSRTKCGYWGGPKTRVLFTAGRRIGRRPGVVARTGAKLVVVTHRRPMVRRFWVTIETVTESEV